MIPYMFVSNKKNLLCKLLHHFHITSVETLTKSVLSALSTVVLARVLLKYGELSKYNQTRNYSSTNAEVRFVALGNYIVTPKYSVILYTYVYRDTGTMLSILETEVYF
jgi:hypothetical protein